MVKTKHKTVDIFYAAGFFDGEGSITVSMQSGKYLRIEVAVSQKAPAVLDWFVSEFGGSIYHAEVSQWKIHGEHGVEFLKLLAPAMIVKSVDAAETINIWNAYHSAMPFEDVVDLIQKRKERRVKANGGSLEAAG